MRNNLEINIWSSPKNTLQSYKTLKKCGMTNVFIDQNYCKRGSKEYLKLINYAKKSNLKAQIFNYNSIEDFYRDTTNYNNCSAFDGMFIWDEPSATQFDEIATIIPEFERRYKNKNFFVNLLPCYAVLYDSTKRNNEWFGVDTYEEYIKQFCEKILCKLSGKKYLSIDFYPLSWIKEKDLYLIEKSWLYNLELISKYAKMYSAIPFCYIQSTSFGEWRRQPTKEDFYYQYFIVLSYGFRGIGHFTYTTPFGGEFAENDVALIDRKNNPTQKYYYVQEVNKFFKKFCKTLFRYNHIGNIVQSGLAVEDLNEIESFNLLQNNLLKLSRIKKIISTYSIVVGEFEKNGKHIYIITNFTDPHKQLCNSLEIKLYKKQKIKLNILNKRTKINSDTINFELKPGQGAILEI